MCVNLTCNFIIIIRVSVDGILVIIAFWLNVRNSIILFKYVLYNYKKKTPLPRKKYCINCLNNFVTF